MVRDFLLILLGLDIGTASPHLENIANAILGWNWGVVMGEFRIAGLSFIVEAVIALIILGILWILHRGDERRKDTERNMMTEENRVNTQLIITAIEELGNKLSGKIDGIAKPK
jgi:uncharacterized membrane protein YciS (DUF1049 family)